jgi:hypothetical protein
MSALRVQAALGAHSSVSPPPPPRGMTGDWAPLRYDMSHELRLESLAHVGAIPVADHPGQPFGIGIKSDKFKPGLDRTRCGSGPTPALPRGNPCLTKTNNANVLNPPIHPSTHPPIHPSNNPTIQQSNNPTIQQSNNPPIGYPAEGRIAARMLSTSYTQPPQVPPLRCWSTAHKRVSSGNAA